MINFIGYFAFLAMPYPRTAAETTERTGGARINQEDAAKTDLLRYYTPRLDFCT